ncbi:MAG: DMT family transporter [Wenzhouxiangella sp.]|jgi:drug/metabolite transporter (DMT)-like permease|nr:DMT family transporter [Wenzhouxiangella sp.]
MVQAKPKLGLWLIAAVVSLGTVPLAKKMALVGSDVTALVAFGTALVSALIVLAWLTFRGQFGKLAGLSRRDWRSVLLVGALGSGLVPLFGILAMTATSASNRALFQSAYPVATAIAARFMLGERLDATAYFWIVLVCIGLVLMNLESGAGITVLNWPFWLLLTTLPLIGLADVIAKRALGSLTPEVIALGRALGGLLVLILLLPWLAGDLSEAPRETWLWILVAGGCMGVFAVALYQVFDRTLATLAASLIALAPLLTLGLEIHFLDLALNPTQWAGFALVLAAVVMIARRA